MAKNNPPLTCDEMRALIGAFLKTGGSEAQRLWDIITCQRGPDSPSERDEMPREEFDQVYCARRVRKRETGEVIRAQSFFGVVGGSARSRKDIDYVILPADKRTWDHYDRHVYKAAKALRLMIQYKEAPTKVRKGDICHVTMITQPKLAPTKASPIIMEKSPTWAGNFSKSISLTEPPSKPTGPAACDTGGTSMKEEEESSPF